MNVFMYKSHKNKNSRKEDENMTDIAGVLEELKNKALHEPELRGKFLASREESEPVSAFCRVCREAGYEIYEMELISAGEEFHAAMKRSTNGGGENSPMLVGEDDFYELFFTGLDDVREL